MAGASVMMLPFLKAMEVAADNQFQAFEIFAEFPQCVPEQVTDQEREKGRNMARAANMALAVHAPFNSINIAAMNPGIRRESVCQSIAAVDLCADLGGRNVIIHTGEYILSENSRKRSPAAFELQWNYNIESLQQVAARAGERGVRLCLENIGFEPEHMDRCVDDVLKVREEVGSDALFFCLDIGHARLNGELPEAIEKMGPAVRHIHFTDNLGEKDDHLPIGKGNFDYTPHLDFFRSFDDIITLEVINIGEDPKKALISREYVKGLLG